MFLVKLYIFTFGVICVIMQSLSVIKTGHTPVNADGSRKLSWAAERDIQIYIVLQCTYSFNQAPPPKICAFRPNFLSQLFCPNLTFYSTFSGKLFRYPFLPSNVIFVIQGFIILTKTK